MPSATGYDVFRAAPAEQTFRQIGTSAEPSYGDAGLKPATVYRYQVRAVSSGTVGAFSSIVSQQTRRKVPPCAEPGTCAVR